MPIPPVVASVELDVNRNFEMPGARLFVFKEGTTAQRTLVPIVFDPTKAAGEIRRGWRVVARRFDRFADPQRQLLIAKSRLYTFAALEPVRGFCVMKKRETVAYIYRCEPAGMPELESEDVWKLTATGRTSQVHDITPVGAILRLLESGVGRFLEDGTARRLEA